MGTINFYIQLSKFYEYCALSYDRFNSKIIPMQ